MPTRLPSVFLFAAMLHAAASAAATAEAAAQYTLRYDAKAESMAVRLCVPHASDVLRFTADSGRYIDRLTRPSGAPAPQRERDGWSAANWRAGECVDYRAALGRAADTGPRHGGTRRGTALVVDPGLWLLRVDGEHAPAEIRVSLPQGYAISAPWHPLPSIDGTQRFSMPQTPRSWLARVAIGRFEEKRIAVSGGTLRVSLLDVADTAQRRKLESWIGHVSRAARSAYGRLPLDDVQVLIVPVEPAREPVVFGQSTRGQGHGLTLFVDVTQPADAFDRDWVAVHELAHLFHPYLGDRGSWLAEGLATYYQNVLRARAGLLTPTAAWEQLDAGFARGRRETSGAAMPLEQAVAAMGERHDFMRVYWSGTAFWLEADTRLRRASGNRLSVDEALHRFDTCCLSDDRGWSPEAFVGKLDALLGTRVFGDAFAEYRARRDFPDLAAVQAELGIVREGDALRFDDHAGASAVRRAIMATADAD